MSELHAMYGTAKQTAHGFIQGDRYLFVGALDHKVGRVVSNSGFISSIAFSHFEESDKLSAHFVGTDAKKTFYMLERINRLGYDVNNRLVVLASSERHAREIANHKAADEGQIWHDPLLTTCCILDESSPSGVIIIDCNNG